LSIRSSHPKLHPSLSTAIPLTLPRLWLVETVIVVVCIYYSLATLVRLEPCKVWVISVGYSHLVLANSRYHSHHGCASGKCFLAVSMCR
jgi:hypothetical protein